MHQRKIVFAIIVLHISALLFAAYNLPIGPSEAKIYFSRHDIVSFLMHIGNIIPLKIGFLNIRWPFLVIHLLNLYLFWKLCLLLLKDQTSQIIAFLIFLFLPGIISSAILATTTGMILALYQSFLLLWLQDRKREALAILPLFLVIDRSCEILYIALLIYSIMRRDRLLGIYILILLGFGVMIYGVDIYGKPRNHFVETIGLYAAIFSPLLFLYFFYAMYRILLKGEKNILWFVSFAVLMTSLFLSIRQRVPIQDFAPYVVVAIPLMVRLFLQTYRVRLPIFRKRYTILAIAVTSVLLLNSVILLFNKPLFLLLPHPREHFAHMFYFPYWIAKGLKANNIHSIKISNEKISDQLAFYGIKNKGPYSFSFTPLPDSKKVSIRYMNFNMSTIYVSKINK